MAGEPDLFPAARMGFAVFPCGGKGACVAAATDCGRAFAGKAGVAGCAGDAGAGVRRLPFAAAAVSAAFATEIGRFAPAGATNGVEAAVFPAFGGADTTAAALGTLARLAGRAGVGKVEEATTIAVFAAFAGCAGSAGCTAGDDGVAVFAGGFTRVAAVLAILAVFADFAPTGFTVAAGSAGTGAAVACADLAVFAGFAALRGGDSTIVVETDAVGRWVRTGIAVFAAFSNDLVGGSSVGRFTGE